MPFGKRAVRQESDWRPLLHEVHQCGGEDGAQGCDVRVLERYSDGSAAGVRPAV
jgi:hypothetical protein